MSLRPRVRTDRPRRATPEERLAALPLRARMLLGEAWALEPAPGGPAVAEHVLHAVLARLDALHSEGVTVEPERLQALSTLATDALEVDDQLRRQGTARRQARAVAINESLGRLRRFQTSAELVDAVCHEASHACRLERVVLSRLKAERWHPWMAVCQNDEAAAQAVLSVADEGIPLEHLPTERAVLASRRPTIVSDCHAFPLAARSRSRGYVVAPLTPAGRVVGFIHADHGETGPAVDEQDRDSLWTFAEAFGRIYERVVLLERMARQRAHVRESFDVVEGFMSGLASSDIELVRHDEPVPPRDGEPDVACDAAIAIDRLLTDREREVMKMMLCGFTNHVIAERLVIKEGTVKSHVKHILRKVGAANRTEAISRYAGALKD